MSLDLDPAAAEAIRRGQEERDQIGRFFVVATSLFVGLTVAALLWWLADEDQRTNTIYTAIATGVDLVFVLVAVVFQWLEIEAGKHLVVPMAQMAAEMFEILAVLLLSSALNEAWAYGSLANVLAYGVPTVAVAIAWIAYKIVKDWRIRARAMAIHADSHDQLDEGEAELVVDSWLDHQKRTQAVYPSLISVFSLPLTTPTSADASRPKKTKRGGWKLLVNR